jgi:hypothetical protein
MTKHECTLSQNRMSLLLDSEGLIINNNLLHEIYCLAENCLSCIDMADFFIEQKRLSLMKKIKLPMIEPKIIEEKQLREVISYYNLDDNKIIESFNEVISQTMSRLESNQRMKLFSPGELLEARSGYAYAEIRKAVDRGVKFEYVIPGVDYRRDFEKLNSHLLEVFKLEKVSNQVKVTYDEKSNILANSKDVTYYDKDDKKSEA